METDLELEANSIRDNLVSALARVVTETSDAKISGLVLCTDDDVMSLYEVHCLSKAGADAESGMDFEFWEWTDTSKDHTFRETSAQFRKWASIDGSVEGASRRFNILVDTLAICREKTIFEPETFLSVSSTDPDAHSQRLGIQAAMRLNDESVAREFIAKVGWKT